jgi:transcriptional regulator with XRE-family HTH domain
MLGELLRRDRERHGLRVAQAAWLLGLTPAEYRRLEQGERWPSWETYDRIAAAAQWPRDGRQLA